LFVNVIVNMDLFGFSIISRCLKRGPGFRMMFLKWIYCFFIIAHGFNRGPCL
jgi:hypothetical protein